MRLWLEPLTATSGITFRCFSCVLWLQDIKDAFLVVRGTLCFSLGALGRAVDSGISVTLQCFHQSLHPSLAGRPWLEPQGWPSGLSNFAFKAGDHCGIY